MLDCFTPVIGNRVGHGGGPLTDDRNRSALDVIPTDLKAVAIEFIRRHALINDPSIQAMFCSSVKLVSDDSIDTESLVVEVAALFPQNLRDRLSVEDASLIYNESGVVTLGMTMPYRDELNREWIVFAAGTPISESDPADVVNMHEFVNTMNQHIIGSACLLTTHEDGSQTPVLISGFTVPRERWGRSTSRLAGHLIVQIHAQANRLLRDDDEPPSGTETYLVTLAMEQASNASVGDLVRLRNAVQEYLGSIPADMRRALQVSDSGDDEPIKIVVPLSGRFGPTYANCYLTTAEHELLGSGFYLQALLPGSFDPLTATRLASRLNSGDPDSDEAVHTTPRLLGSWSAFQPNESSQRHRIGFLGYLPNAGPDFSEFPEHIEGLIREACASWERVDEEITFQTIVEENRDVQP